MPRSSRERTHPPASGCSCSNSPSCTGWDWSFQLEGGILESCQEGHAPSTAQEPPTSPHAGTIQERSGLSRNLSSCCSALATDRSSAERAPVLAKPRLPGARPASPTALGAPSLPGDLLLQSSGVRGIELHAEAHGEGRLGCSENSETAVTKQQGSAPPSS